jgi:hypothetical protein
MDHSSSSEDRAPAGRNLEILAPVLEMLERGIVGALVIKGAAVKDRHHQPDAESIGKGDAEDERHDAPGAQAAKSAKNVGSDDRHGREQDRPANDLGEAEPRGRCGTRVSG